MATPGKPRQAGGAWFPAGAPRVRRRWKRARLVGTRRAAMAGPRTVPSATGIDETLDAPIPAVCPDCAGPVIETSGARNIKNTCRRCGRWCAHFTSILASVSGVGGACRADIPCRRPLRSAQRSGRPAWAARRGDRRHLAISNTAFPWAKSPRSISNTLGSLSPPVAWSTRCTAPPAKPPRLCPSNLKFDVFSGSKPFQVRRSLILGHSTRSILADSDYSDGLPVKLRLKPTRNQVTTRG